MAIAVIITGERGHIITFSLVVRADNRQWALGATDPSGDQQIAEQTPVRRCTCCATTAGFDGSTRGGSGPSGHHHWTAGVMIVTSR